MKKIWKKILAAGVSLCIVLDMPFVLPVFSPASSGAERPASVQATSLNVRSGPGTGYSIVGKLAYGAAVTVVNEAAAGDGALWYQIRFTGGNGAAAEGYVLASYIKFPSAYSSDGEFEQYLTDQGFPESYRHGLRELHAKYPQWIFTAVDTGLDWNEVIQNESLVGRNLVSSSSPTSWKSTAPGAYDWETNTWPGFDGPGWVAASEGIIRYYMDPRNFLNETYIFQFLGQNYDSAIHTREGLSALVKGTFLEGAVPVGSTWTGVSQGTAGGAGSGTGSPPGGSGNTQSGSTSGGGNTGPGSGEAGSGSGSGASSGNGDGVSFRGPGDGGTGGSSGNSGGPGYSGNLPADVQVGVPPGTNVSQGNGNLSSSVHTVSRVSATVIRVGPGEEGGTSSGSGTQNPSAGNGGSGSADPAAGSGTALPGGAYGGEPVPYVDILMEAGIQSGVNPYVLAAMILQEQGSQGKSESISGANGYYNYFNFEAYASNGMTAVQRGLWYASQPGDYMRPWDSVDKAIIGGACQYGQNYVQAGQNTFYLKKFNVQGSNLYKHQYMTNVEGAAAEGAKMAGAYSESMRQSPMQFMIPIFRNMPAESCARPSSDGSANNRLSSVSVDGFVLTPAFSQDTYYYEVSVNTAVSSVMLRAVAADSTAQISGTGTINLNREVTDVKVIVTAQNGAVKEYTVRIIRNDNAPVSNGTVGGSSSGQSQAGGTGQGGSTGTKGTGNPEGGPGFSTPAGEQGSTGTGNQGGPGGSNVTIV